MGACPTEPLRPQFDRRPRLEFHGAKVISDAGLLAYRELDDALDLTTSGAAQMQGTRTGQNTCHSLTALLRQSIFSRLAGYEDLNDARRLRGHRLHRGARPLERGHFLPNSCPTRHPGPYARREPGMEEGDRGSAGRIRKAEEA